MKALLYKDFVSSKSSYLLALAVMVIVSTIALVKEMVIMIPFLLVYMSFILTAISIENERESDFPKFAFTSPIPRETYVKSKYVISILCAIIAFAASMPVYYSEFEKWDVTILLGAISFAIPILLSGFQIPFTLRFGAEMGRVVMIATYFILFAGTSTLGEYLNELKMSIQKMSQSSYYLLAGLVLIATIVLLLISQRIAIAVTKHKEY